jgi:hypothetical protein
MFQGMPKSTVKRFCLSYLTFISNWLNKKIKKTLKKTILKGYRAAFHLLRWSERLINGLLSKKPTT